ncbi:MAG: hypothetical protein A2341_11775 [Deltaproteobacteria bacterium RIFOXYB12_FULL_58_9]|nr:MAG: hypothetical protein A2341_11775 [Deltaproteobacteria bacterium RIFOXYB12_FULL_58_9]
MNGATVAITLDLDGPREYASIHGVELDADVELQQMYGRPLERFVELCQGAGASGTLFVVARDVTAQTAATLRGLVAMGFEVASHSSVHDYGLSRRPPTAIETDLRRSRDILEREVGARPVGFRAPGYHLSEPVLDALETLGFSYSSSVLPSPPYFFAKAAVLAGYRLLGRTSASMQGSAGMLIAPRQPYRPGRNPYVKGTRHLVELPISVATPLRLPVTGASLVLAPRALRRLLVSSLAKQKSVVLNLHAMDLARADEVTRSVVGHQPELRLDVEKRLRIIGECINGLGPRTVVTCAQLAVSV